MYIYEKLSWSLQYNRDRVECVLLMDANIVYLRVWRTCHATKHTPWRHHDSIIHCANKRHVNKYLCASSAFCHFSTSDELYLSGVCRVALYFIIYWNVSPEHPTLFTWYPRWYWYLGLKCSSVAHIILFFLDHGLLNYSPQKHFCKNYTGKQWT